MWTLSSDGIGPADHHEPRTSNRTRRRSRWCAIGTSERIDPSAHPPTWTDATPCRCRRRGSERPVHRRAMGGGTSRTRTHRSLGRRCVPNRSSRFLTPLAACGVRPREGLMRLMVSRGFTLHQSVAQIARLPQEMARTGSKVVILDGMLVMHLDPQVSSRESRALLRRSLSVLERLSGEGVQLLVTTEDRASTPHHAHLLQLVRRRRLRSHPPSNVRPDSASLSSIGWPGHARSLRPVQGALLPRTLRSKPKSSRLVATPWPMSSASVQPNGARTVHIARMASIL